MLSIIETRLHISDEQVMEYPGHITPLYVVAREIHDIGTIRQEAFIVGIEDHNKIMTSNNKVIAVFDSAGGMSHTISEIDDPRRLSYIGSYEKLGGGFTVNVFEILPEAEFTKEDDDKG